MCEQAALVQRELTMPFLDTGHATTDTRIRVVTHSFWMAAHEQRKQILGRVDRGADTEVVVGSQ